MATALLPIRDILEAEEGFIPPYVERSVMIYACTLLYSRVGDITPVRVGELRTKHTVLRPSNSTLVYTNA